MSKYAAPYSTYINNFNLFICRMCVCYSEIIIKQIKHTKSIDRPLLMTQGEKKGFDTLTMWMVDAKASAVRQFVPTSTAINRKLLENE